MKILPKRSARVNWRNEFFCVARARARCVRVWLRSATRTAFVPAHQPRERARMFILEWSRHRSHQIKQHEQTIANSRDNRPNQARKTSRNSSSNNIELMNHIKHLSDPAAYLFVGIKTKIWPRLKLIQSKGARAASGQMKRSSVKCNNFQWQASECDQWA